MLDEAKNNQTQLRQATLELLKLNRIGLATDIDGTISAIAAVPTAAFVPEECRQALQKLHLSHRFQIVAIVTGRVALDGRRLVGLPDLVYLGNHGLETLAPGQSEPAPNQQAQAYQQVISKTLALLKTALFEEQQQEFNSKVTTGASSDFPLKAANWYEQLLFEDKGVTASVHYRLCPDPPLAREIILQKLAVIVPSTNLIISEGRLVIELRPPVLINKGTALKDLFQLHRLDGLLYIGDDVTDVDAFKAIHQITAFVGIAVGVASQETPAVVVENSDFLVEGLAGVQEFLSWLSSVVTAQ